MKLSMIVWIGAAVLLVGVSAARDRDRDDDDDDDRSRPPASAPVGVAGSALVGGSILCFGSAGRADVQLGIGAGGAVGGGGGVVGVPAGTSNFGAFSLSRSAAGSCADATATLGALLPAPLCATASSGPPSAQPGLQFACSGSASDVLQAVGDLAKGVLSLPPAPMP